MTESPRLDWNKAPALWKKGDRQAAGGSEEANCDRRRSCAGKVLLF
jgi:hypothetical protein